MSLPAFAPPGRRADTLAIKARLADLLTPANGALYWAALGSLLTGKITAAEFELELGHLLTDEAAALHNALVLAILYNTTRPTLAPPPSARHAGWSRRRRRADGAEDGDPAAALARSLDPREAKRRRLHEVVRSLSKRDRQRVRETALVDAPVGSTSSASAPAPTPKLASARAKLLPATAQGDYAQARATPWIAESGLLPDRDGMRSRLALVAFNAGLGGGADIPAAGLTALALEQHLTSLVIGMRALAQAQQTDSSDRPPLTVSNALAFLDANPAALISGYALERRKAITPFVSVAGSDDGNEDAAEMDVDEPPTPRTAKAEPELGPPPPPRIIHPLKSGDAVDERPLLNGSLG